MALYGFYDTETKLLQSIKDLPARAVAANTEPHQTCVDIHEDHILVPGEFTWNEERVVWEPFAPPVDMARAWDELRLARGRRLAACDWTQVADAPVDQDAWKIYRQQLRDITDGLEDPTQVVWPTAPAPVP